MSLQKQLADYKRELADTAARNSAYTRPPVSSDTSKRTHEAAFKKSGTPTPSAPPSTSTAPPLASGSGNELLTQVYYAIDYIKAKNDNAVPFDDIVNYLSLPNNAQKHIPHIMQALRSHERVSYLPKAVSGTGKDSFKYRPHHPVTNAEELKLYLARQQTAQGISIRELKDGWPDCATTVDELEKEGQILVIRGKKDGAPKMVWFDSPNYHIKVDEEFANFWSKTKLPASETEMRNELERAGLTSTSQVKEVKKMEIKKDRKRPNRRGGKTTNQHMAGILRDYSKK